MAPPATTPAPMPAPSADAAPGAAAQPALSIITVFWNGADRVPAFVDALESARRELPFAVELLAVDNASSDGTADLIAQRAPWARLVRNDANIGFAPACNQGLDLARGRVLLLLNPDCEANASALAALVRFLDANSRVGAAGCELLHEDGLPQPSYHDEPSWRTYWASHSLASGLAARRRKSDRRRGLRRRARPFRVDWLMGACLAVPRRVFERVGGLDPEYFMYSEDADWCRRIRDAGLAVVHLPGAAMLHHQGSSSRKRPEFAFRRLYRSLLRYTAKFHGPAGSRMLRGAVVADMLLRAPIHLARGERGRLASVLWVARMMASGRDPGGGGME